MMTHATPAGPSARPAPVVSEWVRGLAWFWDEAIEIPVLRRRIGFDAIVGLVPGLGDVAGLAVGALIVLEAARLGAGSAVLGRMLLNLVIDAGVGLVPLVGDLFDAGWKANRRNRILLERWLAAPGQVRRASAAVVVGVVVALLAMGAALVWLVVAGIGALVG